MASPLVDTKFYVPRPRRTVVARPRLSARLGRGSEAKVTLISAPPGFGKTTALADWLAGAQGQRPRVAWLSLDEGDRQPASFWTCVLTALQSAVPGVGAGVLPLLASASPPIETVLATVLNELAAATDPVVLVLDDYHLADGPQIAIGMTFLLERLPRGVHVVLSTRADPDLPLARWRARGELVEVRAADLRFTTDEAATYLSSAGLRLSEADIAVLEGRTEGWVAALQLAALSMQGRDDTAAFIAGFAGDDRYIVDYLVEEVLARQPDPVRNFLVRTCILERLSGPLCDAVTGGGGSRAMLESLDRANLFVVPLDQNRRWYRYHHLFADVLQTHLRDELPGEIGELHRRASSWYELAGEPAPAVSHAVACGDVQRAAELVERALPALRRDRREATIRSWLDVIPADVVCTRPVLAVGFIGALMAANEFDGVPARLREVEGLLNGSSTPGTGPTAEGIVALDTAELARLPAALEMYWAGLALVGGDSAGTRHHAQRAWQLAPPEDHLSRAAASALSGLASWGAGDLQGAHHDYTACVEGLLRAGHLSDVLGCTIALADIRITQGRLRDAHRTYQDALHLAGRAPGVVRGLPDMHTGLSQVALELGDLDAAVEGMARNREIGEAHGLPQNPYRWRVQMALIRREQGDLTGAIQLLDEARAVYVGDFSPNVRPIEALRARLLIAQGNSDDASGWARTHRLRPQDELSYLREYEHITLAAVLLAQHSRRRTPQDLRLAGELLGRLLVAAEQGQRAGSVIEILLLQAQAQHVQGEEAAALASLERALTMAEPEGHVRVFTSAGPHLAALLRLLAEQRPTWTYARHLADVCGPGTPAQPAGRSRGVRPRQGEGVIDPLSDRELEVLRLLGTELDGPDIARQLVVSVNTLRTHTKNIYAKLGVNSRRAAVRRAAELRLL